MADAVRTELSCAQVTELAGYTSRVSEMLDVFEDVSRGVYRRSAYREDESSQTGDEVQPKQRVCGPLEIKGWFRTGSAVTEGEGLEMTAVWCAGQVISVEKGIRCQNLPIITPSGDVVVSSLNIQVIGAPHLVQTGEVYVEMDYMEACSSPGGAILPLCTIFSLKSQFKHTCQSVQGSHSVHLKQVYSQVKRKTMTPAVSPGPNLVSRTSQKPHLLEL